MKKSKIYNKPRHNKERIRRRKKAKLKILIILLFFTIIVWGISKKIKGKEVQKVENDNINQIESIETDNNTMNQTEENQSQTEVIETETAVSTSAYIDENVKETQDSSVENIVQNVIKESNLSSENFSFFYYNLDNKSYYYYNEEKYFTAASTIKVPIAMLYYDKINTNQLEVTSTLQYTSNCYEAGNGLTSTTYSVGQYVPISFLLKQAIVNSDNTAVNILIKGLGYTTCRNEIAKYSEEEVPEDFYSSNIASALYYEDVLTHLYENAEEYQELIEYMKQSSGGGYLKKYISNSEVAHKYGSYNGYVHDYGIVYGDTTYIIGIFTKNATEAEELIANLNLKIYQELQNGK